MMDMLQDLLKEKKEKGSKLSPAEKEAKLSVLKEIKDMAKGDMGEEIKGLKKVTVAAPDSEGLEEGLDKAKELVEGACPDCGKEPCACEEGEADPLEGEEMSPEEIEAMIAMLQAKKAKLSPSEK